MLTKVFHACFVQGCSPACGRASKCAICCESANSSSLGPEDIRHLCNHSIAGYVGNIDDKGSCDIVNFDPSEN